MTQFLAQKLPLPKGQWAETIFSSSDFLLPQTRFDAKWQRCCYSVQIFPRQSSSFPAGCARLSSISIAVMATDSYSRGDERKKFAEIVVIRHGETEWNADGRLQGHLDVELNDEGRKQGILVAERMAREPKLSAVYSSDLKRAFETAEIIAKSCGGLQVIKEPDLRERHLGDLQGLVLREAAKCCTKAYEALVSSRSDKEIPGGGESLDQLYQRCTSALQRIANKHIGERVVVVSHGGVIRSLHRRASPHGRSAGKIINTSVNVFELSNEEEWTIKIWGDVSHLEQSGFLESGFGGDKSSG